MVKKIVDKRFRLTKRNRCSKEIRISKTGQRSSLFAPTSRGEFRLRKGHSPFSSWVDVCAFFLLTERPVPLKKKKKRERERERERSLRGSDWNLLSSVSDREVLAWKKRGRKLRKKEEGWFRPPGHLGLCDKNPVVRKFWGAFYRAIHPRLDYLLFIWSPDLDYLLFIWSPDLDYLLFIWSLD
ncbi:hypothetical protein AVEN_214932-1 [Araneus ventricosus]|uniref:Uncharacterized protein n=1 Tax=Araneus ventricosus TaxID=182803 RepID=A0A4Y2D938_ARAVE|nr:hypothetical protein AVEN_214932-1 [Araneus ventricosus]